MSGRRPGATDRIALVIASAGGAGFMPRAPGTAGAIVGLLISAAMLDGPLRPFFPHAILLTFAAGTWASWRVEQLYGEDSQRIVIDEVGGQMLAFAGIWWTGASLTSGAALAGFLLFRLFDMWKPFPLKHLEDLPYGLGVMADDAGAGMMALGGVWLLDGLK